jgi:uncharacterized repeat protein (TIGR02543 family)
MKRKFFRASWMLAIAGLVAFSFVGTSCGSDDDEEEEKPIQVEKFKVTYDSDGGSEVAAVDVVKGKEANLTNTPTKSGFKFKGWSKVKGDASQIVTSLKVDADVTLYAIWEEGEAPQPDPSKNHFIVVKASDMVDHEWDTQFWFSTPTTFNEGDSWEVSISVKALHSTGDKAIGTQSHLGKAGDYKHWAAIGSVPFTEEWETYTASGEFTADQQDCDFVAFNLNDYNPANTYCFDNISFKINGQEQIKNGDIEGDDFKQFWIKEYPDAGEPVINVSAANVIADGDPIPGSGVVVEKVKITFDLNGAEGTVEPKEVTKGNEVKVADVKAPSRVGFKFLGWSTTANGEVVETYKVEADVTLYAIWQEKAEESGEVDLTAEGFSTWSDWVNGEATGSADCALVLNESTGLPYGDGNVNNYIDLSDYKALIVVTSDGAPRFLLNRDEAEGQDPDHLINIPNNADQTAAYQTTKDNGDGTTTYTIDLAKIVADKGYAHLHAIKGANWANVTVVSMKVTK